jgi:catechol 2,3-dioxygenase-like lactoylglutathione lyase family enzyme
VVPVVDAPGTTPARQDGAVFKISKNFHIIHMTDDLPALDAWYDDVFSVERWMDNQFSDVLKRYGSLVQIGDLCIEPMAPSFDVEGWDQVAVGRFWGRFGKRWHSIAWYTETAADYAELYDTLVANDVRIYGGAGGKAEGAPQGAMFTHPRDTYTQLEFMAQPGADSPMKDPRFQPGWSEKKWADHPLGLLKSSHVTLTVADVDKARDTYVNVLGGTLLHEGEVALGKTKSAFVAVGTDLVVELAQPLDDSTPIGADFAKLGQSLYAVTLRVKDLGAAETYLKGKGFEFQARDEQTLLSDPESSKGVVYGFTSADIPGDTRPTWDN